MNKPSRFSRWVLAAYCFYLILPLYWLLTLALRSNADIAGVFELVPSNPTLANFAEILTNPVWFWTNPQDLSRRPVDHLVLKSKSEDMSLLSDAISSFGSGRTHSSP